MVWGVEQLFPQVPSIITIPLYILVYLPVAWSTLAAALKGILKGKIFTEYFLMSLATIVALCMGEYTEAVMVMLFYQTGEFFQHMAVDRARNSIAEMIDQRPEMAQVADDAGNVREVKAKELKAGWLLTVNRGGKIAADGVLLSDETILNTAALTGESTPRPFLKNDVVLAGMINEGPVINIRVSADYADSRLSNILKLVHTAGLKKATAERFISRFARYYTPSVVAAATAVVLLPMLWDKAYDFHEWLYRGLIFLIISCPCALLISIPLGFFGGIGAASRRGILIKGADFLDRLPKVTTLLLDKTGTLTTGKPEVVSISVSPHLNWSENDLLQHTAALENMSSHPLAKAVVSKAGALQYVATEVKEAGAAGMTGRVNGHRLLAGNQRLLQREGVPLPPSSRPHAHSDVLIAVDGQYAGCICLDDTLRPETNDAIQALRAEGISHFAILSGDTEGSVKKTAELTGIAEHHSALLPEDKYRIAETLIQKGEVVAFAGDGINDAPVLALCQVGIAMGANGADAAIASADIVIHGDNLLRIAQAIRIAKATQRIVWQNIIFALAVKAAVLVMGTLGYTSLWAAIFADVGVALLAILNAVRLQWMKHKL